MTIHRIHSFALGAILAVGLAVCPGTSHAQDLVNGSFEEPAEDPNTLTEITLTGIPGWTGDSIGGNAHEYIINGDIQDTSGRDIGVTPYGQQYLGLNAIAHNSFRSIETQVADGFTAGQTYLLTLYIANLDGALDPNVSVEVDNQSGTGTSLASALFSAPKGAGPYGANGTIDFVPETLTFTALSDTVSISIGNQSRTGILGIDNVSVAAVPEPKTAATLLLGACAFVGFAVHRRFQAKHAA